MIEIYTKCSGGYDQTVCDFLKKRNEALCGWVTGNSRKIYQGAFHSKPTVYHGTNLTTQRQLNL